MRSRSTLLESVLPGRFRYHMNFSVSWPCTALNVSVCTPSAGAVGAGWRKVRFELFSTGLVESSSQAATSSTVARAIRRRTLFIGVSIRWFGIAAGRRIQHAKQARTRDAEASRGLALVSIAQPQHFLCGGTGDLGDRRRKRQAALLPPRRRRIEREVGCIHLAVIAEQHCALKHV